MMALTALSLSIHYCIKAVLSIDYVARSWSVIYTRARGLLETFEELITLPLRVMKLRILCYPPIYGTSVLLSYCFLLFDAKIIVLHYISLS